MERKFCGKCGKTLDQCTCEENKITTQFGDIKSNIEEARKNGSYYIRRFDKIALIQDEVVVKQYNIGQFAKSSFMRGSGNASLIITNKRVISKQDSECLGATSISVEEITLDNIAGVQNYFSKGYTIWRIVVGALMALWGLIALIGSFAGRGKFNFMVFIVALLFWGVAAYMGFTSRKPSYLFSVYASSANQAMVIGTNLRGKLFNSNGYGLLFQYKPTEQAIKMMCEIGACIVDLKQKGDLAIEAWKKE